MKNIFTAILIISAVNISFSQQGWFQQSSGTSNYLYWVHFISPSTGWTVGQANTILKTTNSGLNWFPQNIGTSGFLYSVFFISESTGWVAGQSGTIKITTDAGVTWQSQTSGFPSNYLYSVIFTDVSFGYVVGSGGLILKTIDGGNNWVQVQSGVTNTLSCVSFPVSSTGAVGYAVGGTATDGVVLKTSSFGINWTAQTLGSNWLFGVFFTNVIDGCAVGFNGTIYTTTNGGDNWIPQTSGTMNRLVAVHFPSFNTGYAVGYSGTIIKTTNGGNNWFVQTSPSTNNLWGVYFTDDLTGWAAGWNGTILHTTNGGITYVQKIGYEVPEKFELYQNYPNPFNPSTNIRFSLPAVDQRHAFDLRLAIYDIRGKELVVLIDGQHAPGTYEVTWNASDYPSGVYFYRLSAGAYTQTNKMILIK